MAASMALTIRSSLRADAASVWNRAVEIANVAEETGAMELRFPFGYDRLEASWIREEDPAARGTLWALGVIPVDRWALRLERFEPGHFVERSTSIWFRTWRHERVVTERSEGSQVIDRVSCEPRIPGMSVVLLPIVARVFEARHRHLRRVFGAVDRGKPKAERTLGAGAEQEAAMVVGGAILTAGIAAGVTAYLISRRR